ncbi:hypothetical protein ABMX48_34975 [Streptomyces cavourensis]
MRRRQGSGSGGGSGGAGARGVSEEAVRAAPREPLESRPSRTAGGPGAASGAPGVLGGGPRSLSGMQQTLGNAATARAVRRGKQPAFRPGPRRSTSGRSRGSSCRRT